MKELLDKIAALEKISAELDPDAQRRSHYNETLMRHANSFLDSIETRPAYLDGEADQDKFKYKNPENPCQNY